MATPRRRLLAAAVCAALPLTLPTVASAQAPDPTTLDSVTVTGSRIRQSELETHVPVQVLTREDIDRSGFKSVSDIVQNLTASGAGLNTKFNSSGNFGFPPDGGGVGAGAATVDLRHLGPKRVLVLVDGIRWVNESSGSGVGAAVDLNTIPLALVDRIEVLEDGASSIYGSDAIAGVVNIITRKNVQGGDIELHYGTYEDLGGDTWGADMGYGGGTDRLQWFAGASYFKQRQVSSQEYGPASEPVPGTGLANGSSATPQGRFIFAPPDGNNTYGGLCPLGVNNNGTPDDPGDDFPIPGSATCDITTPNGTVLPPGAGFPDEFVQFGRANRFNFAPYNLLLTPSERKTVFGQVRFAFSDSVNGYVRALYNERQSANQAAPEPFFLGTDAGVYNEWAETRLVISVANPYNPFGFDLTTIGPDANLFLLGRRPVEGGPRRYEQDVETWYVAAGLDGGFDVAERPWSWDINVVRSESSAEQTNYGSYNLRRINESLGDPVACDAIPGCVPLNVFGGPGTITPEMLAFIQPVVRDESENTLTLASANITGALAQMPAGPLGFAAGYEYRKYEGRYQPDPITVAGEYNGVPSGPTAGDYDVNEVYAELAVPLMANPERGSALDLSLAGRYSDYSTFGGESTGKIGLRWQVAEEFVLRGSFAEGFRAPSIGELYGTLARFDATLVDPCSGAANAGRPECVAQGVPADYVQTNSQISVVTSGNADLQPETSRSLMLGAVWSPSFASDSTWSQRMDLGLTFYRHTIDDAIQAPDAQAILNRCVFDADPFSCASYDRSERGQIIRFDDILDNLGTIRTDGWDLSMGWLLPEQGWGQLRFDAKATFVGEYELINESGQAEPRAPGVEVNNSAIPEWTATLATQWSRGPWAVAWTVRHIDELRESCGSAITFDICGNPEADINLMDATTYHDLQLSWNSDAWMRGLRMSLGVNNITSEDPPICLSCSLNGYDAATYDLPGRFFYARVGVKF